jgi:hypothetical protein
LARKTCGKRLIPNVKLVAIHGGRPFEEHVLQKVGNAFEAGVPLIARTRLHRIGNGYRFCVWHRLADDLETIRQPVGQQHLFRKKRFAVLHHFPFPDY